MRIKTIILAVLLSTAAAAESLRATELCGQAGRIAAELATISGLKLRHPVPCDFITKEKVNEFLKKRVKDTTTPEEIRAEELTLKKFGLVPPDFNLADSTVDLLTEQAAAFYDYDKKRLFVTETTSPETQEPVLAHELSHAIADQNFNLAHFIRQGRKSDDGSTARMAVMEGQATWLMSEYLVRRLGQSLRNSPELVKMTSQLSETGGGNFPVFDQAPLYLRLTLVFPYTQGMLFQNDVIARDGNEGFAEVFKHAPASTQQIIHPQKYFDNVQPTLPDLPDAHLPSGYKSLVGGTLGELDEKVLLEQFVGKERAGEIAPHWRGSAFELRENKKLERTVLLYSAEWDSEQAARDYLGAYRQALVKKWKKMDVTSETPDAISGTGDEHVGFVDHVGRGAEVAGGRCARHAHDFLQRTQRGRMAIAERALVRVAFGQRRDGDVRHGEVRRIAPFGFVEPDQNQAVVLIGLRGHDLRYHDRQVVIALRSFGRIARQMVAVICEAGG